MTGPEVLIVDNDLALAQGIAHAMSTRLSIECTATNDIDQALGLVRQESIRVAVLDQRMPECTGIELMKRIHDIDAFVKVILLSGLAKDQEIVKGYDEGIVKFLHKNQWRSYLAGEVQNQLLDYEVELWDRYKEAERASPVFETRIGLPLLGHRITYYLLPEREVVDDYYIESSWRTAARIDAGVETEVSVEVEWKTTSETVAKLGTTVGSELNLSAGQVSKLGAKIKSQLSSSVEYKQAIERRDKITTKRKVALPPEPIDPNQLHIRARAYEVAPVFILIRSTIVGRCPTCGTTKFAKLETYLPKSRVATRQIDYMSDESGPRITNTGIHDVTE